MDTTKLKTYNTIAEILIKFFDEDKGKILIWLISDNSMLGGIAPLDMIRQGREEKLLSVMQSMVKGDLP